MDNNSISLIMMVLLFAVFYFVLIRPQRQKDKKIQEMRRSLKVGDEIITIGGIYGKIVRVKGDDRLVIQTGSDRVKLEMARWSISSLANEAEPGKAEKSEKEEAEESRPTPKNIKKLGKAEDKVEEAVEAAAEAVEEAAEATEE